MQRSFPGGFFFPWILSATPGEQGPMDRPLIILGVFFFLLGAVPPVAAGLSGEKSSYTAQISIVISPRIGDLSATNGNYAANEYQAESNICGSSSAFEAFLRGYEKARVIMVCENNTISFRDFPVSAEASDNAKVVLIEPRA